MMGDNGPPTPIPPTHPWLHRLWPIGKYVQSKLHQHAVIRTQHLVKQYIVMDQARSAAMLWAIARTMEEEPG